MLYIIYNRQKYYINLKLLKRKILGLVSLLIVGAVFLSMAVDFCKYPEKYCSTWKYQLKNEVKAGEPESVAYYNRVYKDNGIKLFED